MSATLADLKSAIQRELYNRTDLTTEISAAINAAIAHYQREKFYFTEEQATATTVKDQASLGLPSDLNLIDGITITYSTYPVPMVRRDWLTMQQLFVNTTILTGPPTDYAIYANQLWFWPTPNGAYALTLYEDFQNAAPVQDTDSNNWTVDAEELIRSRAVADIRCHVLKQQAALLEMSSMRPEPFLSIREKIAHGSLVGLTMQRTSSGRIKPIDF